MRLSSAAFNQYLRRGRPAPGFAFNGDTIETKFNSNHDPANGQFTSAPGEIGTNAPAEEPEPSRLNTDDVNSVRLGSALIRAADIAEHAAAGRRSTGDCYKYVKHALLRAGAVSDYLPGIPAKDAGVDLAKRGFFNLLVRAGTGIGSPYDAPVGAVLVYDLRPMRRTEALVT